MYLRLVFYLTSVQTNLFLDRVTLVTGAKSIAVPGEVLGFWEAHKKYGKLPWADLFTPVIEMAEE